MSEEEILEFENCGKYTSAINCYRKLLSNNPSDEDEIYFKNRIRSLEYKIEDFANLAIGEAFFPTVIQSTNSGTVLKLKIVEAEESEQYYYTQFNHVKKIVEDFLSNYIFNNIKQVYVFDWGLNKLSFKISGASKEIIERTEGDSLQLALALALISYIIHKPISKEYVFSGTVNSASNYLIGKVDNKGLEIKASSVFVEAPFISVFFIPQLNTINFSSNKLCRVSNLYETIEHVFPDLKTILAEQYKFLGQKRIHVEFLQNIKTENGTSNFAKFEHGTLGLENTFIISKYFENISSLLSEYAVGGLIISGLKASYLAPILSGIVANLPKDFIALRYPQGESQINYSDCPKSEQPNGLAVVIRVSLSNSTKKVGDIIEYFRPEIDK